MKGNEESFAMQLKAACDFLQVSEKQLATRLNINFDTYKTLAKGGKLPAIAQSVLKRKLKRVIREGIY